jgi:hypothetical protein
VILRHAIAKAAAAVWVADFRPGRSGFTEEAGARPLADLVAAGEIVGIGVRGWLLVGRDGAVGAMHGEEAQAEISAAA